MAHGVTLQINLAPFDLLTVRCTVPHQIRQFGGQVDEILFILDTRFMRGRYARQYAERLDGMRGLLRDWSQNSGSE